MEIYIVVYDRNIGGFNLVFTVLEAPYNNIILVYISNKLYS